MMPVKSLLAPFSFVVDVKSRIRSYMRPYPFQILDGTRYYYLTAGQVNKIKNALPGLFSGKIPSVCQTHIGGDSWIIEVRVRGKIGCIYYMETPEGGKIQ